MRRKPLYLNGSSKGRNTNLTGQFIPPQKTALPAIQQTDWVSNPIDYFILKKLEEKGWQPTEQADKVTLLRRVTFDLTGLPSTIEEIDNFLSDTTSSAFEKVVDRLLASPHYGERMATDWLDVARFADTHGYTVDRFRDMSPWRDWVLKAFNDNLPFDQFITWQLAGDLIPNAAREQIIATGFNRNHQQNMEGGIVEEEFRVEYVADRTNTLGTAFLGLTVECARCHDHKYDPISQKEYFQLFSFFNNVKESGQISWNNAMPVPTILLTDEEQEATLDFLQQKISEQENALKTLEKSTEEDFEIWATNKRQGEPISSYPKGIVAHFDLNDTTLQNQLHPVQRGAMKQQHSNTVALNLAPGKYGNGLLLDGDAWLDLGAVGVYDRMTPFSVGLWVNIPTHLKNGVIFHKGEGATLHNFRGYHLALKNNRLEIMMAHTHPFNAIIQYAKEIPRNKWIHLTLTYDGSSKAKGLKTYLNGKLLATDIDQDHLYKDILLGREKEPGLQIGARWRGKGLKGAVVDDIMVFDRTLTALEVQAVVNKEAIKSSFQQPIASLEPSQIEELKQYYLHLKEPKYTQLNRQLQNERNQLNQLTEEIPELMVIQEMKKPRPAFVLDRGQYDSPTEEVFPNTPTSILPLPEDYPKNRLGLAQWLIHAKNPLTTRVIINRLWQHFFGNGLVKTVNDFGFQGETPSHPQLLDWLAIDFRESGWNIKRAIKQIVLSASYQQSSKASAELMEADKNNIWLARGPSARLTAEMIRDNALAASGLLVKKLGGPSVKPYQPAGLWQVNGGTYQPDEGENLYRRSLYTFWKRTVPNPTQATFDAPDRSHCAVERQKTSTPLQALVLLNDPTFIEAAKVMGQQISEVDDSAAGIATAFQKLTGRKPTLKESQVLLELQETSYQRFKAKPAKAKGWINTGDYELTKKIEPATLAANAVVVSTIINLDASIIKR